LVEELSLREFLLDQILSLQELLESSLVHRCIEELLGRELVASPPSTEDILNPPAMEGKVVEGRPMAVVDAYPEPFEVDNLPTPEPIEALTIELQLAIAFEVFHRLKMATKIRLLSVDELDLIEFLVAQVASLSSSLACKVVAAESSVPLPVSCEVMILQCDPVVPSASPRVVGDASAVIVGSSAPPSVAFELQAIGVGEFFKMKPPDSTALEAGHK
jgi:hypothetical protein